MSQIEQYIRQSALARGIDPDIAVRVARSEGGLEDPTRQSDYRKNGVREPSYGPFQLLVGGGQSGFPTGMGNAALKAGIDPRDPNQWQRGVDFALDGAAKNGWGAWYGAKAAGIGNRQGIGRNAAPQGVSLNSSPVAAAAPSPIVGPDGPKGQEAYLPPLPERTLSERPIVPMAEPDTAIASAAPGMFPPAPAQPSELGNIGASFQNEGFLGGMQTLGDSNLGSGIVGLGSMLAKGGGQQAAPAPPPPPVLQVNRGDNPGASQLMGTLRQKKRGMGALGLSLMG